MEKDNLTEEEFDLLIDLLIKDQEYTAAKDRCNRRLKNMHGDPVALKRLRELVILCFHSKIGNYEFCSHSILMFSLQYDTKNVDKENTNYPNIDFEDVKYQELNYKRQSILKSCNDKNDITELLYFLDNIKKFTR